MVELILFFYLILLLLHLLFLLIQHKKQGRNALARVNQYKSAPKWFDGTLEELKDKVVDAVKDKFSSIEVDEEKDKD
jgi:outer membrane protein assembly factor BamD (BamD/ComL family)